MADLKDLVGKRILVKKVDGGDLLEAEITEVSPSGQYMRVAVVPKQLGLEQSTMTLLRNWRRLNRVRKNPQKKSKANAKNKHTGKTAN